MLVVKVEVWPMGDEKAAREIGRANVVNVTEDGPTGDYTYEIQLENAPPEKGLALNFERRRGPWELVHFVLADALELPRTSEKKAPHVSGADLNTSRPAEAPKSRAPFDTEHKDAPVCPHCGEVYEGGDYFFPGYPHDCPHCGEESSTDCPYECERETHCRNNCGGEFIVTRHVTVTYSTRALVYRALSDVAGSSGKEEAP